MNAREIERLAAQEASARRAESKSRFQHLDAMSTDQLMRHMENKRGAFSPVLEYPSASSGVRGDAKTELQHLIQRVETQLAHHHTLPTPSSPAAREVKSGTREEVKRLCDTLRSQQEIRQLVEGNFGNGACRIHVLL